MIQIDVHLNFFMCAKQMQPGYKLERYLGTDSWTGVWDWAAQWPLKFHLKKKLLPMCHTGILVPVMEEERKRSPWSVEFHRNGVRCRGQWKSYQTPQYITRLVWSLAMVHITTWSTQHLGYCSSGSISGQHCVSSSHCSSCCPHSSIFIESLHLYRSVQTTRAQTEGLSAHTIKYNDGKLEWVNFYKEHHA